MKCLICGQEIQQDSMFCVFCGHQVPRCPGCGEVLTQRSAFCCNDGTRIPDEINALIPETLVYAGTEPSQPAQPQVPVRFCEECGQVCETLNQRLCNACMSSTRKKPPKKKKKNGFVGILVVLLLLILAFGAGFLLVKNEIIGLPDIFTKEHRSEDEDEDEIDEEETEEETEEEESEEEIPEDTPEAEADNIPEASDAATEESTEQNLESETVATEPETTEATEATSPGIQIETQAEDPMAALEVGDTFYFGTYEQDNNSANGHEEILWIVLAKEDDRILATTYYGLDSVPYHSSNESVTWETCSLRTWLNSNFYYNAFSLEEQSRILASDVSADNNPTYSTDPGKATTDYVFLLSLSQTLEYFPSKTDRLLYPTAYAVARNAWKESGNGAGWWLVMTPGETALRVVSINTDGSLDITGGKVNSERSLLRPAIWIQVG